jgi:hypothetical protein
VLVRRERVSDGPRNGGSTERGERGGEKCRWKVDERW